MKWQVVIADSATMCSETVHRRVSLLLGTALLHNDCTMTAPSTWRPSYPFHAYVPMILTPSCLLVHTEKGASTESALASSVTSRREKSSSLSKPLSSGTPSQVPTPPPPSTGGSSREGSSKEVKANGPGSTKSTSNASAGNSTPLADSQFTDLFGPPIQTRPATAESSNGSTTTTTTATPANGAPTGANNGNTSKSKKKSKTVSRFLYVCFLFPSPTSPHSFSLCLTGQC